MKTSESIAQEAILQNLARISDAARPAVPARRARQASGDDSLMTQEQFAAIAARMPSRLTQDSIEMARLVLVEGQMQTAVADAFGVKKTAVNRVVQRFRKDASSVPVEWQSVEGYFPPEIAAQLSLYAKQLLAVTAEGGNYWSVRGPDLRDVISGAGK